AEGAGDTIRLPANNVLQKDCLPVEAPGRATAARGAALLCQLYLLGGELEQAVPRRGQGRVHPGEMYPRVSFIVTNLARPAARVVAFYNQRGTAEQWIKKGNGAITWTRLPCRT